jgi:nucleoside-diphosphate-sugar epimerase
LGRSVVAGLANKGHQVRGVARSSEKETWLRAHGAEPVVVDLFDGPAVKDAVAGSDAVLHLATSIPEMKKMIRAAAWDTNNRLRTLTTRLLVDAALDHGVRRFVAESISFCYPDRGAEWIDETVPFIDEPFVHSVIDLETEVARFAEQGGRGVVLRFGLFYGPEARGTDEMLLVARRRIAPLLGAPDAYTSSIHTDDAARAVIASLDVPAGTNNFCDEPLTRRAVANAFASAFGLKRPRFVPPFVQRAASRKSGDILMRSQRVSNARFRGAADWEPEFPTVEVGYRDIAARKTEIAAS